MPAKYALGGEIHSVSKRDRGGENIYSFFFAHTPTIKVVLYKSRENRSEIWAGFELAGSTENSDKISYFLG